MDTEEVIYKHLPPTSELVKLLTPPQKLTRMDIWNRILMGVVVFAVGGMLCCFVLIESGWLPKHEAGLVGAIFSIVAMLAWIASVVIDIVQGAGTLLNPARELAEQFDRDMEIETQFLPRLRAIPIAVLVRRHQRLESQLQAWEKWLDTTRLMGLLGPPLIFVGRATFGGFIQFGKTWNIEVLVSAFLTGVMLGAISFRSGMKRLHRVSSLLKRSAESRRATATGRRLANKKR